MATDNPIQLIAHFDLPVTKRDRKRLSPHLSGWNRLNEILILNGIPTEDLKKLIMLEVEGKKRAFVITKLVGRLKSKERQQLLTVIKSCLKVKLKPASSDTAPRRKFSATNSSRRRAGASRTAS